MKQIGFFGGSFDPIHFGHLNLAIEMLERAGLDEIVFCPAYRSPFKEPPVADPTHRLEMVKLAIRGIGRFRLLSIEAERHAPSFTVDTLRQLQKEGILYRLLLSEESAAGFSGWKESEELLRLAPPLVGSRLEGERSPQLETIHTPLFDISSTEVRRRLKQKMYCGHLVPAIVLDYIAKHRLYS